jgi:hypothetical protein
MELESSRVRIFVYSLEEAVDVWRPNRGSAKRGWFIPILPTPEYDGKGEVGLGISSRLKLCIASEVKTIQASISSR